MEVVLLRRSKRSILENAIPQAEFVQFLVNLHFLLYENRPGRDPREVEDRMLRHLGLARAPGERHVSKKID